MDSKNTFRTYSLNETASKFHLWHSDLEAKKCLRMTGMAGSMITQRALSHLWSVEQVDPDLSRIWTKALWVLPSKRQRGCPNTCVHNADHLRMGEVPHNVAVWNQAEEKLLTCTLWEVTKPSMYVVFSLPRKIIRMTSIQIQLHSTMSATSLQKHQNAAYISLPCSYTRQIQRFFRKW